LSYDVIVIKQSHADSFSARMSMRDTTLKTANMGLKSIMTAAYGVREGLISGLPAWAEQARYDIDAKVVDPDPKVFNNMTREQRQTLVRSLLTERFHLQCHIEMKTLPVYDLVIAKDGPKFKENPPPGVAAAAGMGNVNTTRMSFDANSATLLNLTSQLSEVLDRSIVDKTGLTGRYDLHLKYTPNDAPVSDAADAPPNLFTALEEQLGLKLVAAKGPVQTLVVDHIEQPTEN
jgi:uncharacterized protein (TIGR03435 family)